MSRPLLYCEGEGVMHDLSLLPCPVLCFIVKGEGVMHELSLPCPVLCFIVREGWHETSLYYSYRHT